MYLYKKIIVALDLSDLDKSLIEFTSKIAQVNQSTDIYFLNVIRHFNIPDEVLAEFPDLKDNAINERTKTIKETVDKSFTKALKCNIHYEVRQGNTSKKILKLSAEIEADLIVVGNKSSLKGSGVAVQRIARRAACSLLILPETAEFKLKKILVPSDFSDYSTIALEEAIMIAEKYDPNVEITVQNVFSVPAGYHYTGKNYEEFAEVMKKHAEKAYANFVKNIDFKNLTIKPEYTLDENDDPVEDIYEKALTTGADLIVIGAKGRTATAAIFLGSMAERLIQVDNQIPLMVVRPKGKNYSLLDYFKEL
jgi:nucleotide-binding universal stress UspA family protein